MKIMVAIPVYDGKLQVEVASCLSDERVLALLNGDDLTIRFLPNCSHAAMGRNQLAQEFLDSDADRLFFLDADITFEAGSLLKLAHSPLDFVAGAYRYKTDDENYPIGWLNEPMIPMNKLGLIEVGTVAGGFMSLSRKVLEDLKAAYPRKYEHFGRNFQAWFQMLYKDGQLYGEDSYFCKEWRDLGGQIWVDPNLTLTHWNFNRPFVGNIGKWIKSQERKGA